MIIYGHFFLYDLYIFVWIQYILYEYILYKLYIFLLYPNKNI